MVEDANTKMLLNHKINLRIPRASNLVDLKLLLIRCKAQIRENPCESVFHHPVVCHPKNVSVPISIEKDYNCKELYQTYYIILG